MLAAAAAVAVAIAAVRPLMPRHTLRAGRGLPSVIGTRGLMSAAFFCGQAYIVFVLQERWGLTAGEAGIALTVVGVVWASTSQLQARLGERLTSERAMQIGTCMLLVAMIVLWLTVRLELPAVMAGGAFVLAGAGMGFGFTRTGVAMLAASSDPTAASTPPHSPSPTRSEPHWPCRCAASGTPRPSGREATRSSRSSASPWSVPWARS